MSELNWGGNGNQSSDKIFVNTVKIVEAGQGNFGGLNCKYEKEVEKKDGSKSTITGFITIPIGTYSNGGVQLPTQDFLTVIGGAKQELIDSILEGNPDWNTLSSLATGKFIKIVEYATDKHSDAGYVRYKAWAGYKGFTELAKKTNVFSPDTENKVLVDLFKANTPKNYDPNAENIDPSAENEEVSDIATNVF